eukprot:541224_1
MGSFWSSKIPPPPKTPGAMCSENGCFTKCITCDGHRIRKPHKSRCCSVCSAWYCGEHKIKRLIYTDIFPQSICIKEEIHHWVYKCHQDDCLQMHGLHRS